MKAIPVIKRYLDEMPALRHLVLVIKVFLAHKGLNSAANGGLGSYATICLAIHLLQVCFSFVLGGLANPYWAGQSREAADCASRKPYGERITRLSTH